MLEGDKSYGGKLKPTKGMRAARRGGRAVAAWGGESLQFYWLRAGLAEKGSLWPKLEGGEGRGPVATGGEHSRQRPWGKSVSSGLKSKEVLVAGQSGSGWQAGLGWRPQILRPGPWRTLALTLSEAGASGGSWAEDRPDLVPLGISHDPSGCHAARGQEPEVRSEAHPVTWQEARLEWAGVSTGGGRKAQLGSEVLQGEVTGLVNGLDTRAGCCLKAASSSVYSGCFVRVCLLYVIRPPRMDI